MSEIRVVAKSTNALSEVVSGWVAAPPGWFWIVLALIWMGLLALSVGVAVFGDAARRRDAREVVRLLLRRGGS